MEQQATPSGLAFQPSRYQESDCATELVGHLLLLLPPPKLASSQERVSIRISTFLISSRATSMTSCCLLAACYSPAAGRAETVPAPPSPATGSWLR
eukprot:759991-Hanusia_phi.AAC.1